MTHLSPDAPAVDVSLDGNKPIKGLSYPNFAPDAAGNYLDVAPESYDISVTTSEGGAKAFEVEGFSLEPNKDYTILAVGELSPEGDEPGIRALPLVDNGEEDPALPPRDKTLVRFVHASPDAGAVDIAVDGNTLLNDVTFGTASGYIEAESGERTIEVQKDGTTVLKLSRTGKTHL